MCLCIKDLKEKASCSIGYYIELGKRYRETGVFHVDEYEETVASLLPNCGGQTLKGYANLLWFTEQVRNKRWHHPIMCLFCMQVAVLLDINAESVWAAFKKLAPQLDQLQHKNEVIVLDEIHDPETVRDKFWDKVGNNLIELANCLESHHQVNYYQ